jgi:hypothetical protein
MPKRVLTIILISLAGLSQAQQKDMNITKGGFVSVNFNQVQFSNWAQGGDNSSSGTFIGNTFVKYKKGKKTWENYLDVAYGILQTSDQGFGKTHKNEDKIDFTSKYGRLATHKVYYSALLNFRSQFAKGYNYPNDSVVISNFFSPAYLTIALGMDYKPNDYFSIFVSPATAKFTFVTDKSLSAIGAYGVDSGKFFRKEFGASMIIKFQKEIFTNVNLLSKLTLFDNYSDKRVAKRGNVDVNFEILLSMKVNKFLSANMFVNAIYDDDILVPLKNQADPDAKGKRLQIKETMGVGLSYKF